MRRIKPLLPACSIDSVNDRPAFGACRGCNASVFAPMVPRKAYTRCRLRSPLRLHQQHVRHVDSQIIVGRQGVVAEKCQIIVDGRGTCMRLTCASPRGRYLPGPSVPRRLEDRVHSQPGPAYRAACCSASRHQESPLPPTECRRPICGRSGQARAAHGQLRDRRPDVDLGSASQDLDGAATAHNRPGTRFAVSVFDVKNACNSFSMRCRSQTRSWQRATYRTALVGLANARRVDSLVGRRLRRGMMSVSRIHDGRPGAAVSLTYDPKAKRSFPDFRAYGQHCPFATCRRRSHASRRHEWIIFLAMEHACVMRFLSHVRD